jgi:hypothetical protein
MRRNPPRGPEITTTITNYDECVIKRIEYPELGFHEFMNIPR